jgi:glucose/arabinose dehydrogenase
MKTKHDTLPVDKLLASAAILLFLCALHGCRDPSGTECTITLKRVARGIANPTAMAIPDDGKNALFVTTQTGSVVVIDNGTLLDKPFLDISDKLVSLIPFYDEAGLLGIAFHPDYAENGRFFLYYNAEVPPEYSGYHSFARISEFHVSADDPYTADPASETVVLEVPKPQPNHNGGQIAFGPDGCLYAGLGDGGGANDTGFGHTEDIGNGQDPSNLLGSIIRLDVSVPGKPSIPSDNPFAGNESGVREEIYAYGFRNPWRFSFDSAGRLFCGDVGQSLYEEISIVEAGGNYGWNIKEGGSCFNPQNASRPLDQCPDTGYRGEPLIDPVIAYSRPGSETVLTGRSVIGGYVYEGDAIEQLQGSYVFGDWSKSFIVPTGQVFVSRETAQGTWDTAVAGIMLDGEKRGDLNRFLLSFGRDAGGELYLMTTGRLGPSGATGEIFMLESASCD